MPRNLLLLLMRDRQGHHAQVFCKACYDWCEARSTPGDVAPPLHNTRFWYLQKRLTGDPYIVHCVETAAIVECLHATSKLDEMDERWVGLSCAHIYPAWEFSPCFLSTTHAIEDAHTTLSGTISFARVGGSIPSEYRL